MAAAAVVSPSFLSTGPTGSSSSFPVRQNSCRVLLSSKEFKCGRAVPNCEATPSTRKAEKRRLCTTPRAFDNDTLVGIGVGLAGIAIGIGIPVFYEMQVKGAESRENDQPCFPCKGTGSQSCRFCTGTGRIVVELGNGVQEVSQCVNCEGRGSITCTTCQGTGVQPRYLDRREFKDDDD